MGWRFAIFRRIGITLITVGAVALGVPVFAQAASGVITVTSAGSPADHAGLLSITFGSTTPVVQSSISAALYAPGGATTAALTVTDFSQTSGSTTAGGASTWTVTSPISQAQLPLGTYSITVQASDTGGDSVHLAGAGTLAFAIQPTVDVSVSLTTFSYGQNVTISGADVGLYPDGSTAPVDGQQIEILASLTTTTDASGEFSMTVQAGFGAGAVLGVLNATDVEAVPDATTAQAFSNVVELKPVQDPADITESVSPSAASYGGTITVTGTADYEVGSTWLPLANAGIGLYTLGDCGMGSCPSWTTTTGTDGAFTFSVHAQDPAQYELALQDVPGGQEDETAWFSLKPVTFTVVPTHLPVAVVLHTPRMTTRKRLRVAACIVLTGGLPIYRLGLAPFPALHIQYAADASGPWKTLVTGKANADGCFTATVKPRGEADYYRAATRGDAAYLAGVSQPARAVSAARWAITKFRVTPRLVKPRHQVSVSGQMASRSRPIEQPNEARIEVLFRATGSAKWVVEKIVETNDSGDFAAKIRLRRDGWIEARFAGNLYDYSADSAAIYVRVAA